MTPSKAALVRAGLRRAMTSAGSIAFLAIGVGAAGMAHSWWLAIAGVPGAVVVAVAHLSRVAFWRRLLEERRARPVVLPNEVEITDETAHAFLLRLEAVRDQRERAVWFSPQVCSAPALDLLELANEVEARAVVLIHARDRLGSFVAPQAAGQVASRLAEGADAVWLAHIAEERAAIDEALAGAREQLDLRLTALIDTLAMVPGLLLVLRLDEDPELGGMSEDQELCERLRAEVAARRAARPEPGIDGA